MESSCWTEPNNSLFKKNPFSVCLAEQQQWCSVISINMRVTDSLPSCKCPSCRWHCKNHADPLKYQEFRQSLPRPQKKLLFLLNCSVVYWTASSLRLRFAHSLTQDALFFSLSICSPPLKCLDWRWLDANRACCGEADRLRMSVHIRGFVIC